MATGNFYRGTSQTQDVRFSNKDKKLLNSREWPPEFDLKVNMKKVEISAIRPWIQKKITEILGFEDEVVVNFAISELECKDEKGPCPKRIQLNLTGFLTNKTSAFMKELWKLLLEAQDSPNGIPPSLIQERKEEILQKKEEILSQEAKLESIRAFLKQAGEEIKSKLHNKKDTNKHEETAKEKNDGENSKKKKHEENNKKKNRKRSRSRSKDRAKKNEDNKRKEKKDKSGSFTKENKHSKDNHGKKHKIIEKKKLLSSSGSEESDHSSDDSSPISEASND